jgi:hypothetical protein
MFRCQQLFLITCLGSACAIDANPFLNIPTFYIDPHVVEIIEPRIAACMQLPSISNLSDFRRELKLLSQSSATEYFRSHELLGFIFFMDVNNPYRKIKYEDAEFEYIPLMPLSWRINPANSLFNTLNTCNYSSLIQDILTCQEYLKTRDKDRNPTVPKFSIASTYNMRTAMGSGMPTQIRKGAAWLAVSQFVMDLSIGHYERWPQCPDLVSATLSNAYLLPTLTTTIYYSSFSCVNRGNTW